MALLEATILPILIPLVILAFGKQDIFLLETAFPWLILVPILTASRYGTWLGLLSLAIFSLFCLVHTSIYHPSLLTVAIQILAGGLILVIFIGEMIQRWQQRHEQQRKQLEEYQLNSAQSEQALQLLHISYSQIEEELVTKTQSLTSSLRLINISVDQQKSTKKERLQLAINNMQNILQQYEWLESAAFYYVNTKGKINPKLLGRIGTIPPNLHLSPLLAKVINSKKSISVNQHASNEENSNNSQQLQAGIPLLDDSGYLWGVLAINHMTPSVFKQQNLNLLALLCGYVANLLSSAHRNTLDSEALFLEIFTSLNIVLNTVQSLTLLTVDIQDSSHIDEYQSFFVSKIRGANRVWKLQKQHSKTLIILLPLLDANDTPQWNKDLDSMFLKQFGISFSKAKITLKSTCFHNEALRLTLKKHLDNITEFEHAHFIR
ncbi:MAG TPA: hypothetical protein EYG68_01040 [Leucothrix mucor]|nr:hypothetical protein [Leucothrix mucor]